MIAPFATRPARAPRQERGFVMVTGLLFLVVVTLLGLALFRSTGLMERVSANSRDKQRAFESSQAALQYGEWFLINTSVAAATSCATPTAGQTTATMHVCTQFLPASRDSLATLSTWQPNAFAYPLPHQVVSAGGGLTTTGSAIGADVNYQANPGVVIEDLGLTPDGKSELYQLTAYGYGGNADTSSILRSTYKVTSPIRDLSEQP